MCYGTCAPGTITVTLERGTTTVVIRQVPAQVCDTCGEEYLSEEITDAVLSIAEHDVRAGVQVDIREFQAAYAYSCLTFPCDVRFFSIFLHHRIMFLPLRVPLSSQYPGVRS